MQTKPSRGLVIAAFAAIYLIWGSSYISIHFAIQTLPPFLMTSGRFLGAGSILIIWSLLRGAPHPTRANWRAAAITGGFMFLLNNTMIVWAEDHDLPSSITALLLATMPMWMVAINWARGSRPTLITVIGLIVGFSGIMLLMNSGNAVPSNPPHPLAPFAVLLASACWAAGSLYSRGADLPRNAGLSTGMQLFAGGFMVLIVSIVTGDAARFDPAQVSVLSLAAVAYLMIFASIVGFSAFVWLMRVSTPAKVATYSYVNPIVAVFLGWLLAQEPITWRTLLAAAVIIASVVMITAYGGRSVPRFRLRPAKAVESA